jgi:hypothetical protein
MGTFFGSALIDELLRRLRDLAATPSAYPRADVLDIINRCQRSINSGLGLFTASASLTITNASIYNVTSVGADVIRVVDIRDNDRILKFVPWDQLIYEDPQWIRRRGSQPEIWSRIGRELLVITPISDPDGTVTCVYLKQTTNLADAAAPPIDIPDEFKPVLLDLAEAVLLFRAREWRHSEAALARALPALGLDMAMQTARRLGDRTHE